MFVVYVVRQFTIDWVNHMARAKNPQKATVLARDIAQFLGIGNSTGLGMVPYLIKHPHVVHSWVAQREQALHEIIHAAPVTQEAKHACMEYVARGIAYFSEWKVPDVIQQNKNELLVQDLRRLLAHLRGNTALSQTLWREVWEHSNDVRAKYSAELRELFLNVLMEVYPSIAQKYENFAYISEPFPATGPLPLREVRRIVEQDFDWALRVNYEHEEATHFFWYRSEEKAEPRLGERSVEDGADKEMKIDVGRRICHMHAALQAFLHGHEDAMVADFLLEHPQWSGEIRRVVGYARYPYGEIRENILTQQLYAIDILRLKLAFFGAVKFDPKSDRWLRVTLFQGAPLLDSTGSVENKDDWFLYRYEGAL